MDKAQEVKKILDKTAYDGGYVILDNEAEIVAEIVKLFTPPTDEGLRGKIAKILCFYSLEILTLQRTEEIAGSILSIIKEVGYVKLDEDQTLPEMCPDVPEDKDSLWWKQSGYLESQMDMIKAGWRKIR